VPLPDFTVAGFLPPGIHAASLAQVQTRFGAGAEVRQRQAALLRQVIEAARPYLSLKRVLVWGSFVTTQPEPNDLDYSVVVAADHRRTRIARTDTRFFVPSEARRHYGVDRSYLIVPDYPLEYYIEKLDFMCHSREGLVCGIVEISLRGEYSGEVP
jgi:hypothetical protein